MPTISEVLQLAVERHRAGDYPHAETLYRQVLQADPLRADAWHLLGVLSHQTGRHDAAIEHIRRAIDLGGESAEFHHNLAGVYRAAKQPQAAVAAYKQALALRPDNAASHNNLAVVLLDLDRAEEAAAHCRRAIDLQPDYADACNNMGVALRKLDRIDEAIEILRRAVNLKPDYVQAHTNLGLVLRRTGRHEDAAAHFERAIQLGPQDPEPHNNLGNALNALGRLPAAESAYREALRLRPDFAQARYNLALVLEDQGRLEEARESYVRALQLRPEHAQSHNNLGNILKHLGRLDDAVACYREALRLEPAYFNAHLNLGSALHEQGHQDEALAVYASAMAIRPTPGVKVRSQLALPLIMSSVDEVERQRQRIERGIERLLADDIHMEDPLADVGTTPFYLAYLGCNARDMLARIAEFYTKAAPSLGFVAPHCATLEPATAGRPIRVGFLSRYFYNHPVGIHYANLLRGLSRERFEVVALRFPGRSDPIAKSIEDHAQEVVTLPTGLDAARRAIAAERLDVLVYTEIGMDPLTYYLAYSRLAPVQCVLPGHPVTTGIPAMDYFISSVDLEPDGAEEHYTERLVRLNSLPTTFQAPAEPPSRRREEFRLDPAAHVYMCAQTLTKLHPAFDALAARILAADPRGRLALFQGNQGHWTVALRERLHQTLGDSIQRVDFVPRQELTGFRQALALADVVLDSVFFSGGTSTLEALWVGTPIVTLPGPFMRGRQTLACYRKIGIPDCVANDEADFVRIALRLANDRAWRDEIRGQILAGREKLVDSEGFVRELEAFFTRCLQDHRFGRPIGGQLR